ncbi:sterol desaturase family protein [Paraburkholderia phosphatilytica]|uniref:sterol desaturase family protein n=1 Tax=Paraburkholderia phosphatilytica TaxID=2282883 RepID=UPI0013DED106|nr:sterol desaturase family protein [Paraburkholderia phosphatilytica]
MTASLLFVGVMLTTAIAVERFVPHARPVAQRHQWFNLRYTFAMLVLVAAARPLLISVPLILTHALGAGWIAFGRGAIGWVAAFVTVLVFTDLLEYLFHRAQHRFSFLWKMHELHHSAEHYDVTLTYRHYWLEPMLKAMFMYPFVGILFKVPPSVSTTVGIVFLVNHHVAHLNLRYAPRRITLLFSYPQYHRLHHSRHERDYNRNFCDLLPLWDVLFGTHRRLGADEFVDVGLSSGEAPRTLLQALRWPWVRNRQMLAYREEIAAPLAE